MTEPLASSHASLPDWLAEAIAQPRRQDLFALLRRWESAHPMLPRLGEAALPAQEPMRIGQPAELDFAPAPVQAIDTRGPVPRVRQRVFGLTGPNGPLPLHLTELARERERHHGDAAMQDFLDLLTHRFALLFHRAWAQAQPVQAMDRADDGGHGARLGALAGLGLPTLRERDALGDAPKLAFLGRLSRQVRDADGLAAWCREAFDVPARVEPWCGHWLPLPPPLRAKAGGLATPIGERAGLGGGLALGRSTWDVQHKFRIVLGPMPWSRYRTLLPGSADLERLRALVRQWVGLELDWDLRLVLDRHEIPPPRLHATSPAALGHSLWLGTAPRSRDGDALLLPGCAPESMITIPPTP
ncbi:type VI secretion system baseplate subunit TssG [Roseateles amylovorans]|uniref:Type VI secretion system baseplate subunit TssG n=1 Tax=Roseateles amylovorans TaxID=2978473 RepID=A0ABY6ATP1_9BURK|nr:type VI secretion system baseplate subunit TssG [Roseateles amylovorans]UXH76150.1 type VI secretion system baseplate subunit TssG [Roseateles amylovorans]